MLVAVISIGFLHGCDQDRGQSSDGKEAEEVVVFAAASLQPSLQKIADQFQQEHGIGVQLNFAASGVLAQQIISGARADVFISADRGWIDNISSQGLVAPESVSPLVSNSMVIVGHRESEWEIDSVERLSEVPFRYLVVGDPAFVPAGKYAQRFLQSVAMPESEVSVWDSIGDRISPTSDLRRVLALVESDRSLIGFAYSTDILKSNGVRVLYTVPNADLLVDYFVVRVDSSEAEIERTENVNRFVEFLTGELGSKIFEADGFVLPAGSN